MNIVVFDTETTSLEKPFCYNIGYVIFNMETLTKLVEKDFVCEQVWHNPMLFTTAYYADKRPIYVDRMRKHETIMNKYGYICQEMIRDFKAYNVEYAFAYNSSFDEKVFEYNCEWFKCNNPFDNIPIKDIRAFAHKYIVDDCYKEFCDEYGLYTESGNYSTTAETMFRYIDKNMDFEEEHTALADSEIELEVLLACYDNGATLDEELTAKRSIPKARTRNFTVKLNGEVVLEELASKITYRKSSDTVLLEY